MLKLTFLGTSSGVPTIRRNVTALALQTVLSRDWWMVDCGEATQHRLQRTPLSVHDLAGICITHIHGDHSYGLPGLLASASMTGRTRPLLLIAPQAVRHWVEATLLHTELFLTFPLIHVDVDAAQLVHEAPGIRIERFGLSHRVPSVGFRFTVETAKWKLDTDALRARGIPSGPDWGRLQAGENIPQPDGSLLLADDFRTARRERAVAVVGGDNDTPSLLAQACEGAQLLVHEATYTSAGLARVGPGRGHSSAQQVAGFATEQAIPNLILTHFSPRYDNPEGLAELEADARSRYRGTLFLARDFDQYALDAHGVLSPAERPARQERRAPGATMPTSP